MGLPPAYGSEGAGFQLFIQSNGSSGVYADAAARDVYFGANPSELVRLDSNEFLIIKLLDDGAGSVAYQQRSGGNWVDVTSLIQGETGPGGATGNSYFFSSIAARDTFFSTSPNEGLLENGLPITVNVGGTDEDITSDLIWGGETDPVSYDDTLWRLPGSEISSGTLYLGIDGASISSGSEVLNFITTDGSTTYIHGIKYDDTGSENPTYWKLGALAQFPLADVFDTVLSDPQILSTTNTLNSYVKDYTLIPATSGELRVQTWLGTDDTGPSIVDVFITVAPGDVGNQTVFTAPNNTLILTGQDTYTKLSGITLYGGLQTLPTFVGQVVPFVTLGLWAAESYEFITADNIGSDTEMLYNNAGVVDGAANITYSGTSLDFADNTSIKMGTDDDLSIDHNGINTIISNSTGEIFVDNTSPSGSIIFRLLGVFPGNTRFDIRDSTSADIFSVLGSGAVQLQDNVPLRFGAGNDFTIIHNETDTLFVSNTGNMEFYNTDVAASTFFTLGTDTAATSFQVRDNSATPIFEVFGDGTVSIPGDVTIEGALYPENVVGYIKNGETGFAERHISTGVFSATTIPLVATGPIYGAQWGKEGTRLYVTTGDSFIYQYNLTVPYDISTATFTASNSFVDPANTGFFTLWNDDGTVFWHGGRGCRTVTLTSAWEISGIDSDVPFGNLSFRNPFDIYDLRWNFDGTKALGVALSQDQAQSQSFIEWDCTTPYDLTTRTAEDANIYLFPTGVPDGANIVKGFDISPDGRRVYLSAPSTGIEYEVVLETAWDLSSSVLVDTITRTAHTDIVNYSMAPDASGMVSVTPVGLIVQKKYGLEFGGNLIVDGGNVGIGTSTPNAPLQFSQGDAFRKIVLHGEDNNNEFYGFGVNSGRLLYQVDNITADHVFFAATSFGSSHELMRITGDQKVGIGGIDPNAELQLSNAVANRKIVLYEGSDNDHQFYGFGLQAGELRYQVQLTSTDHVFYAGTSSTTSNELARILGNGNVTIGTVGSGGRFTFVKTTDDSSVNIYSGSATGSASTVFHNSASAIAADIIYNEIANNFSISTEAAVDLILATGAGANIGVNKPLPVSTLHISEGTTTSDSTTGTTFEQIGLGSAVTHYVRTNTGTVFSSGIDEDDIYKISNDYDLAVNTDIAINTEGNIDFKNTIATPYGGFGRLQNLILWSEDTANTTVWNAQAPQLVVTGDQAIAPDGTLTADEWAYTGSLGLAMRNFAVSLNIGVTYTVSFWARALVSEKSIALDLGDGVGIGITVLVTDDLQRYSVQLVAGAQDWLDIATAVAVAGSIYVWGFQVNEGTERLPYTRTEAVSVHGTGPESGLAVNHSAIFSTIAAPNYSEGTVFYDDGDKALSYYNEDPNVTVGIGRDLLVRVQNDQGVTISSGEAVYINGSSAGIPTVRLARSDNLATSSVRGIVHETLILDGEIGYILPFGLIEFLNTSSWLAGDELYLSSTVAGALTKFAPTYPNHIISLAEVVTSDLIVGSIQVHMPERIVSEGLKRLTFAATTTTGTLGRAGIYAYTATGAPVTLTLSTSTLSLGSLTEVVEFIVIDEAGGSGTNAVTLDTEGTAKINGVDTYLLNTDHTSVTLYTNGVDYFII